MSSLDKWTALTFLDWNKLGEARRQVHQATQIVAFVGRSYMPEVKSDEFANLDWLPDQKMLAGRIVGARWQFRAAISPSDFSLHLLTPQNHSFANFQLHGKTFQEGIDWLKDELEKLELEASSLKTELPYPIPEYPTATGATFDSSDKAAFAELSNHYNNAFCFLTETSNQHQTWMPFKCWPHHFDIATRRRFEEGENWWQMGIGFSPGDDHNYNEPYYHLTRWPYEDLEKTDLPELGKGMEWRTEGWFGIVIKGDAILAGGDVNEQKLQVLGLIEKGMTSLAAVAMKQKAN